MAALKSLAIFCILCIALAAATPIPEPGWKGKHTHYIIHVPYHIHTVHHHHVKKVPVYIKHEHHDHHEEEHHPSWDWD